ncbi:hypothetical protein ONZ51_g11564 [Trametes cubensis]|uniref:Uncharacterized protein n=1 Tax=Trametes cubensis TaxID=1111947 RepID=A0AAD7X5C3_9APHY|nr:hypothetical protein ONZ51_g11564 [Trametes cubensis]
MTLPTFSLPEYTLYSPSHGFVEAGIHAFLASQSSQLLHSYPSLRPNLTLFRMLYDNRSPPPHPYTRASSAYSAVVQLYARSSQLHTAFTRFSRFGDTHPFCQAGCDAVETPHHIFVDCPSFTPLRETARTSLLRDVSEQVVQLAETTHHQTDTILAFTAALFSDDGTVWPQHTTHFYLGTTPPLPFDLFPPTVPTQRVLTRVVHLWHIAAIRLTSRIWGEYSRRYHHTPSHTPPTTYTLPPHLFYLINP